MPSTRRSPKQTKAHRRRAESVTANGRPSGVLPIVATVALLTARFLVPAEASVDGETLWIVQLWLVAGIVCVWHRFLDGQPLMRFDLLALAVGLIVAGHITSGVVLLFQGGDKRAAVNLMWEWGGLAVTFYAIRTVLNRRGSRTRLLWALTSVTVALAVFGLYQHYVWFPKIAGDYRAKRTQLDDLLQSRSQGGTATAMQAREKRIADLRGWFIERGIRSDPAARKQWKDRLESTEPFGTFALANTFAGLLAAMLFPALTFLWRASRDRWRWVGIAATAVAAGAIVWCLVLTKSRTAWVGFAVGGVVWWGLGRAGGRFRRKWVAWALGGAAVVGAGIAAVALTGGLDAAVVSEAPKSLRYRAQYWTGSAAVLRESPLLGTGPGNFRQHYLKYKSPESSEEIRDPHNLFLDVWCNGGLPALAGLLLWIVVAVVRGGREKPPADERPPDATTQPENARWIAGVVVGFLLAIAMSWFIDDGDAGRNALLLGGTIAIMALTFRVVRDGRIPAASLLGGLCALLVHLCGAGGIEMPAIAQLLFVLSAAIPYRPEIGQSEIKADGAARGRLAAAFAGTVVLAILFGGCLSTGTIQVVTRVAAISNGRRNWLIRGRWTEAERDFRRAIENDPLSAQPLEQLAQLRYTQWRQYPADDGRLRQAVALQRQAIVLNPHAFGGYQVLGRWLVDLYEATHRSTHIKAAVAAYARAVSRYPHNAQLLSEQVTALALAGRQQQAAAAARKALTQDDINRREGHVDKYLPVEVRRKLTELIAGAAG
ncbi:MAG: O-antigen ligase family protein [Planctomycetaceae bacterium]